MQEMLPSEIPTMRHDGSIIKTSHQHKLLPILSGFSVSEVFFHKEIQFDQHFLHQNIENDCIEYDF